MGEWMRLVNVQNSTTSTNPQFSITANGKECILKEDKIRTLVKMKNEHAI